MSSLQKDNQINNNTINNSKLEKGTNIIKNIKNNDYKLSQTQHPLEYYALGKINKEFYNNSSTFYNLSSLSSTRIRVNNSSHDLFNRNLLSVNNSYFDKFKQVKKSATLNQLNKNEPNYLNPLLLYKIRKAENIESQKRNNINSLEWLNIIKSKLFSIDINSKIKNGTNISRNEFYEQKNKMILSPKNLKDNFIDYANKNNISYQFENKKKLSDGIDYNYNTNTNGSFENIFNSGRFKKDNEKLNKLRKIYLNKEKYSDYWKKLRIEKSHSTDELISKDFKKCDEKQLKSNFLYFDKNYTNIIRHKNWWKIEQ
jgi:hypothetical protein